MKRALLILALLHCCLIHGNTMQNKQDVIAVYGFHHHTDPDGRPSRNDRRYHEQNLYLYGDGTFKLVEQKGRLSPEYVSKFGIWDIVNNELIISILQRECTNLDKKLVKEKYRGSKTFTRVKNHSIANREKQWKFRQGMRPVELFEKHNNR